MSVQDVLDAIKYLASKFPLLPLEGFSSYISDSKIVKEEQLETIKDNPDYAICSFIYFVDRYVSDSSELKEVQAKATNNINPLASNLFKSVIKEINEIYFNSVQTKLTSERKVFPKEILKLLPDEGDFAIFKLVMRIDQYARKPDAALLDQISSIFNIHDNIISERRIELLQDLSIRNCILFALMMSDNKQYWDSKWVQTIKEIDPKYKKCLAMLKWYHCDMDYRCIDINHNDIPKNSIVSHFVEWIYLRDFSFSINEKIAPQFYDGLKEMKLKLNNKVDPLAIQTYLGLVAIKFTQHTRAKAIITRGFESFIESFAGHFLSIKNSSELKQLLQNKILMQILGEIVSYDFSSTQCVLSPAPLNMCIGYFYAMRLFANENQSRVNELFWAQLDNMDLQIKHGPKRRFEDRSYSDEQLIEFYAAMYQLLFHMTKQGNNTDKQRMAIQTRIESVKLKIPPKTIIDEQKQWLVYSTSDEKILESFNFHNKTHDIILSLEVPTLPLEKVDKRKTFNSFIPSQNVIGKPQQPNRPSFSNNNNKTQPNSYRKIHDIITRSEESELPSYVIEKMIVERFKLNNVVDNLACLLEHELQTEIYLAGGGVRDKLESKEPRDYDVVVIGRSLKTLLNRIPTLVQKLGIYKIIFCNIVSKKHPTLRLQFKDGPTIEFKSLIPIGNESVMDTLFRDSLKRDFNLNVLYMRLGGYVSNVTIFSFNGALTKRNQGILSTVSEISSKTFTSNPLCLFRLIDIKIRHSKYQSDASLQKAIEELALKWLDIFDDYLNQDKANQQRLTGAIEKLFERYNVNEINYAFDQLGILKLFTKHSYESILKVFLQNSLVSEIKGPLLNWILSISKISNCEIPFVSYVYREDEQHENLKRVIQSSNENDSSNEMTKINSIETIEQVVETQLPFSIKRY